MGNVLFKWLVVLDAFIQRGVDSVSFTLSTIFGFSKLMQHSVLLGLVCVSFMARAAVVRDDPEFSMPTLINVLLVVTACIILQLHHVASKDSAYSRMKRVLGKSLGILKILYPLELCRDVYQIVYVVQDSAVENMYLFGILGHTFFTLELYLIGTPNAPPPMWQRQPSPSAA